MHEATVEIFSDLSNAAIIRHPGRKFPGVLIQGDTLYSIASELRFVFKESESLPEEAKETLTDCLERFDFLIEHYKQTLNNHQIEMPF